MGDLGMSKAMSCFFTLFLVLVPLASVSAATQEPVGTSRVVALNSDGDDTGWG